MSTKRVLVTGGAGFIGSHVTDLLARQGHAVTILDNLASGDMDNIRGADAEFVLGDVCNASTLDTLMAKTDAVIHLAAEPLVQVTIAYPVDTHSINYVSTLNVLQAMVKHKVRRIVYASSAAVYPNNATGPVSEQTPADPSSPYGLDKLFGEYALRVYRKLHGIHGTSLRFFNIYGERQKASSPYSGVISLFASRINARQPITVFGDGTQCRDFVYVGDLARVIAHLAAADDGPDLMNAATGRSVTLLQLIESLEQLVGTKAERLFVPTRPGDIHTSQADISLLQQWPDLVPTTDLTAGLAKLLQSLNGCTY